MNNLFVTEPALAAAHSGGAVPVNIYVLNGPILYDDSTTPEDRAVAATPLSADEQRDLHVHSNWVDSYHTAGYTMAGGALQAIHERRLYRASHSSFAAFVKARFDMSPSRAYRLMAAAEVCSALESAAHNSNVAKLATPRESVLRPLTVVPSHDERHVVIERLIHRIKGGERLTARIVQDELADALPQYSNQKRTPPQASMKRLPDPELEKLAGEIAAVMAESCPRVADYNLVLRRAAQLANAGLAIAAVHNAAARDVNRAA